MDKYVSNESTSEASLPSHSLEDGLQVGREVLRVRYSMITKCTLYPWLHMVFCAGTH